VKVIINRHVFIVVGMHCIKVNYSIFNNASIELSCVQTPFPTYILPIFFTVNNLGFITNRLGVLELNISPISTYKTFTLL
jgi:hypothetical protein